MLNGWAIGQRRKGEKRARLCRFCAREEKKGNNPRMVEKKKSKIGRGVDYLQRDHRAEREQRVCEKKLSGSTGRAGQGGNPGCSTPPPHPSVIRTTRRRNHDKRRRTQKKRIRGKGPNRLTASEKCLNSLLNLDRRENATTTYGKQTLKRCPGEFSDN